MCDAEEKKYENRKIESKEEYMRTGRVILGTLLAILTLAIGRAAYAYDYGDYRSSTLVSKAWGALNQSDLEAALAYTNKCIELYADKAKEMQASLKDYAKGTESEIHAYWALNDVATSLFIQGEAYRKADMKEEAKTAFEKLINEYSFGQCWDPKGWFWKPAEAAKEKIALMESGSAVDFSDTSSSALVTKAWAALEAKDLDAVNLYANKVLELYTPQAKEMQASLKMYAWETKEKVFSYWALNDVGTALYIRGKANEQAGNIKEAKEAYEKLVEEFKFAQCWDPGGWFWRPAEDAEKRLEALGL